MNTVSHLLAVTALALGLALPASSMAQTHMADSPTHATPPAAMMTEGEVKKVDTALGKITLKHGHILHLDMPPMTMVFTAKDPALLTSLQPGDKVRFTATMEGNKMVVTDIRSAR